MYLGIDIGTSGIKVVLLDGSSIIISKTPLASQGFEQDPSDLEEKLQQAICQITAQIDAGNIRGISLCGHGPSVLFVDRRGVPLTSIVTWQDKRAQEEAKSIRENYDGFFKDATSYEAKVLWFFKNYPQLFSLGNKVLYPKDYIIYKLCGQTIIDKSAASTIYFYDRSNIQWKFDRLGIPNEVFPTVISSWEQVEVTGTKFSRDCNLPDGIPIFAGGIDAYCEAVGAGAINYGQIVEGTGTSTCISVCCKPDASLHQHVIPNSSIKMKTISYTGGSVEWFNSLSSGWQDKSELKLDLDKVGEVLFLPYLIGERSPVWDEKASGAFIGLTKKTSKLDMYKAVLQGVAFAIKQNINLLQEENSSVIRAVGGGARNNEWLQMKADITGKIFEKLEVSDSAALGSALLAAVGSGNQSLADVVAKWVKVEQIFYPSCSSRETYQRLFQIYEQLYPSLKTVLHELADLRLN